MTNQNKACYLQVRRDKALLDTWDSLSLDNRQPLEAGAVRSRLVRKLSEKNKIRYILHSATA